MDQITRNTKENQLAQEIGQDMKSKADDYAVLHNTGDATKVALLDDTGKPLDDFQLLEKGYKWYRYDIISPGIGIFIKTDIPGTINKMFELLIEGNGYQSGKTINTKVEGYQYQPLGTFILCHAVSNHPPDIKIFEYNGFICFHTLQSNSCCSLHRFALSSPGYEITSVTDEAMPSTGVTKLVAVPPELRATESWVSANHASSAQGALADSSLQNPGGTISDANAPLSDGIYAVAGAALNFPFDTGILIVKNDSAQRCDLAFGWISATSYRHKTATRRWTAGVVQPWEVSWTDLDFSQDDIDTWRTALQPGTAISNIANLQAELDAKGVQLTADQPNAKILLKDANGNTLTSLDVGFLNNEGTTITFNATTQEIELKDDLGNLLSSFPASALVANMPHGLILNGTALELVDVSNNVLSSVTLAISNVEGLTNALAGKEPAFTKNTAFNKDFGAVAGTVAQGNDGRFHTHANQAILDAIDQASVDAWDAAGKAIRVATASNPTISTEDDVVIITTGGLSLFPSAATAGNGKEIFLVAHQPAFLMKDATNPENYIDNFGNSQSAVFGAVQLKSDGTTWYEINNRDGTAYNSTSSQNYSVQLTDRIVRYTSAVQGLITLPNKTSSEGFMVRLIFEKPAKLNYAYKDTNGESVAADQNAVASGTVLVLRCGAEEYEKIN